MTVRISQYDRVDFGNTTVRFPQYDRAVSQYDRAVSQYDRAVLQYDRAVSQYERQRSGTFRMASVDIMYSTPVTTGVHPVHAIRATYWTSTGSTAAGLVPINPSPA